MSKAKKHVPELPPWNEQEFRTNFLNWFHGNDGNRLEIPFPVFFHPDLSSSDKLLYGVIHRIIQKAEWMNNDIPVCIETNKNIGKYLNLTPQSVSVGISKLTKSGFLILKFITKEMTGEQIRIIQTTGKEFEHGQTI